MRKNIGWQERQDGLKVQIRVRFEGGERIIWQHITKEMNRWERFEPSPEQWTTLLDKTKSRYVRRQAPYRDLQLVERLAGGSTETP